MSNRFHPDFLHTAESRRWTGPLSGLLPTLKREARKGGGVWAWRMLPRGAVVGLRIRVNGSLVLRIARRSAEVGAAWEREIAVFLRELGCEDWSRQEDMPETAGKSVAVFVEPPLAADAEPEPLDLFGPPAPKRRNAIAEGR